MSESWEDLSIHEKKNPIFKITKINNRIHKTGHWMKSEILNLITIFIINKQFKIKISKLTPFLATRSKLQITNKFSKERKTLQDISEKFIVNYEINSTKSLKKVFDKIRSKLCNFLTEYNFEKELISNKTNFTLLKDEIESKIFPILNANDKLIFRNFESLRMEVSDEDYIMLVDICKDRVPILNYFTMSNFLLKKCEREINI